MSIEQSKKIICFNGPPHVGKDTAAAFVMRFVHANASWMNPRHMKMSEPLKKAAHALYDVFHPWDFYDRKGEEGHKDLANAEFLGLSPREAYIAMSEDLLKKHHGPDALGFIMRKRILKAHGCMLVVMSDTGFVEELSPLIKLVGERNVLVVELHAVDRNFDNDSRGYIGNAVRELHPKVRVNKITNTFGDDEDIAIFKMMCEGVTKNFLQISEKTDG